MHAFRSNTSRTTMVVGVASLPALALLCVAIGLFDWGGTWIVAGVGVLAAAIGVLLGAGVIGRRMGALIEVDAEGIRATDGGETRSIRWADAVAISVGHGAPRKGTSIHQVRVQDPGGTEIEVNVPLWLGRPLEPAAVEGLAILEQEAGRLAEREARRGS